MLMLGGWTPHQAAFEAVVKLFGVQEWSCFCFVFPWHFSGKYMRSQHKPA